MVRLKHTIKEIVAYYKKIFKTNDPFEQADFLFILYQIGNISIEGCYMYLKNHRYIFINQNLSEHEMKLVMAHKLGHAVLHRKENCYFIKSKTLLLNSKNEIEANKFAMELLIDDAFLEENKYLTIGQMSHMSGYCKKLIELGLKPETNSLLKARNCHAISTENNLYC